MAPSCGQRIKAPLGRSVRSLSERARTYVRPVCEASPNFALLRKFFKAAEPAPNRAYRKGPDEAVMPRAVRPARPDRTSAARTPANVFAAPPEGQIMA